MPTDKRRINLTIDDDLYSLLCAYRKNHDAIYRPFWKGSTPMASVVVMILREYFRRRSNTPSGE